MTDTTALCSLSRLTVAIRLVTRHTSTLRCPAMDRIEMLKQFLSENPGDAFARYGLAMEYSKAGQTDSALEEFRKIVATNQDYVPAYQMAAQMLAEHHRHDEARQWFTEGIAAARRTGNFKAATEMEGMLAEL